MIIILAIIVSLTLVSIGGYVSKRKFEKKINNIINDSSPDVNTSGLENEFDRIEELQRNLTEIRNNIDDLEIPVPEESFSYDDTESSLGKISTFFEQHQYSVTSVEQLILDILPTSQIGNSLVSLYHVIPKDLGNQLLDSFVNPIHDGIISIPSDGLHNFLEGFCSLSRYQQMSILNSLEHHNMASAIFTPIKSGVVNAVGLNDSTHEMIGTIKDVSSDIASALESSTDIVDLSDSTNFDITGHIPIITIAVSSFREYQLLNEEKTNYISSLKNITLDAAGAGIGGMAGAKGGAVIGSVFGPAGTLVGGILGGIAGAVTGRYVTNEVKRMPLKNAIEDYKNNYSLMKRETEEKSKQTLRDLREYALEKRCEFENSDLLYNIPVTESDTIVTSIALALYQFVLNEIIELKKGVRNMRNSIWYSDNKYNDLLNRYEQQIKDLEKQLPTVEQIKNAPTTVVEVLVNLKMPNRKSSSEFQYKIDKCRDELKVMNDKNNSSILMWSYIVNNLYQNTLNEIADYSNEKMEKLNKLFTSWKTNLEIIENKIEVEKGKLGL